MTMIGMKNLKVVFRKDNPTPGLNNFVQQCMSELLDNNLLESLLMKLEEHGHLNDFMMLLKLLKSGEFSYG